MKIIESIPDLLSIIKSLVYQSLLDLWNGNGSEPTVEFAKATLIDLKAKLKTGFLKGGR